MAEENTSNPQRILVAIPTYNELQNVMKMARDLALIDIACDILFIDDNSPDGTGVMLNALERTSDNIKVIHRPRKLGVGSAHKQALLYAKMQNYDILITMDSDFTHSPDDIQKFLDVQGEPDIVVGSRHILEESLDDWKWSRKVMTRFGHFLTRLLLEMDYDATGAFRLYRFKRIAPLFSMLHRIEGDGYEFFFESLTVFKANGCVIKEVPIILPSRTYGHSKLKFRDLVRCLWTMLKLKYALHFNRRRLTV